MTRYELTTLVADEATSNPAARLIEAQSGQILTEEAIGKRRLAYPINGLVNAVYHRITFNGDPARIGPLTTALSRDPQIGRHLLVIQRAEPVSATPVVDDATIEALGDVKEMVAAEEKAKSKVGNAPLEETEHKSLEQPVVATMTKTPATEERPSEVVAAAETAGVKDESAVETATRQAALDEKLKSILGK